MKVKPSVFRVYVYRLLVVLAVCYLLIEFCLFLKRTAMEKRAVLEYEWVLCNFRSPETGFKMSPRKCPTRGIVTSFVKGNLEQMMWQYSNVLAVSIALQLEGHIPTCLKDNLARVFSNLTVPVLPEIAHCNVHLLESVNSVEDWKRLDQSLIIGPTDIYEEVILKNLEVICSHFVIRDNLSEIAWNILSNARGTAKSVTYIGVYISNPDANVFEKGASHPKVQFFINAMNHFRTEYKDSLFVVVALNELFWERVLPRDGVYVVDEDYSTNISIALAVLSKCNHSIIAEEGLALWGAILSRGDAIVSFSLNEELNTMMQYNKNWNYLLTGTSFKNKFPDTAL